MAGEFDQAKIEMLIDLNMREAKEKVDSLSSQIKGIQSELRKEYSASIGNAVKKIDTEIKKHEETIKKLKTEAAKTSHQIEIDRLKSERAKIIAENKQALRDEITTLKESETVWSAILEKAQKMDSFLDKSTKKFKEENDNYAAISRNLDVVNNYLQAAKTLTADWDALLNKATISAQNLRENFTGTGLDYQRLMQQLARKKREYDLNYYGEGPGWDVLAYQNYNRTAQGNQLKDNLETYKAYSDYTRNTQLYKVQQTAQYSDVLGQAYQIGYQQSIQKAQETVDRERIKTTSGLSEEAMRAAEAFSKLSNRLGVAQLMLRANYAAQNLVIGGFRSILNYTVQYDAELHQLQSIAAVSDTTMRSLRESISAVATTTKFTSLEVAKAGTVLAQAGLSVKQIETTLPAIAKLATATGTDLATSTDVVTSTLNIYSLQASEAEQVTNALTTAMNESKADIAGFQTAIQYAGNFAAQLGMTYEETAAAIAAATQAGIRSKSMLGTGLRAVLTEFLKPTKNLQTQLEKVGLTIADIDVRTKGFNNVLKTLKDSGFGAVEAFRGMERRGAAFLVSIINQTDFIDDLRNKMAGSTAAAEANETQMKSLLNQWKNFVSVSGEAAEKGLGPITKGLSSILSIINKLGTGGTGLIYSAFFGIAAPTTVLLTLASLGLSIGKIGKAVMDLVKAIRSFETIREAAGTFEWIKNLLSMGVWGKITVITAGLTALGTFIYYVLDRLGVLTSDLDKAKGRLEDFKGALEESKEALAGTESLLERAITQRERLQDQSERDVFFREILNRYPEAVKLIDSVTLSYEDLIKVLKQLNAIEQADVAQKARNLYEENVSNNRLIAKETGRNLFRRENLAQGNNTLNPNILFSYKYNSLLTQMKYLEDSLFSGVDFRALERFKNPKTSDDLDRYGRKAGIELMDQLEGLSKGKTQDEKVKLLAQLANFASELKAKGLGDALPIFNQSINNLQLELEAFNESRKEQLKNLGVAFGEDIEKAQSKLNAERKELADAVSDININTREDKDVINRAIQSLEALDDSVKKMEPIRENGKLKDFGTYTDAEAAQYMGYRDTGSQKAEQLFRDMRNSYIKEIEATTGQTLTIEEATRDILGSRDKINTEIQVIQNQLDEAINAIRASGLGSEEFERYSGEYARKRVEKLIKAAPNKHTPEAKATARASLLNENREIVKSILTKDTENTLADRGLAISSSNLTSDDFSKMRDAFKNDAKTLSVLTDAERAVSTNVKRFEDKLGTGKTTTGDGGSGGGGSGGGGRGGYKFDPEAARFRKFYSDINVATKNAATEYQNAESPLDLELAKWKGNVSAAERMYGASSGVVEAESIRMRNAEKAQLPQRQENLVAYQAKIQEQLDNLLKSDEYSKYTEYENLERQRDDALASGNDKLATTLDRQMKSLEKTYQKVASTTESLTKKNEELKEKIEENNRILEKENEKRTPWGELSSGFGDAATKYVDANQRQGLYTFRGSMEFLSTKAIDSFDSSMTTMFQNIADGSMKAGEAFKEFGRSVIKTIRDVAIQMAVKQGISALFSYFGGVEDMGGTKTGNVPIPTPRPSAHAQGGIVVGPVKNRDSVDMKLMPGEYVLKKSAVDTIGKDYLDSLNYNAATTLSNSAEAVNSSRDNSVNKDSTGVGGVVNVYVVGQEQQQQMTPNDVVVTITQDMLTGGQTKRLVKQIAMGSL